MTCSCLHAVHQITRPSEIYLPSRLMRTGSSSFSAQFMKANSRPYLHSSARHCHRLPSSLLIENASEHGLATRTRPEAFPIKANDFTAM